MRPYYEVLSVKQNSAFLHTIMEKVYYSLNDCGKLISPVVCERVASELCQILNARESYYHTSSHIEQMIKNVTGVYNHTRLYKKTLIAIKSQVIKSNQKWVPGG
jgi:hypothetical protein